MVDTTIVLLAKNEDMADNRWRLKVSPKICDDYRIDFLIGPDWAEAIRWLDSDPTIWIVVLGDCQYPQEDIFQACGNLAKALRQKDKGQILIAVAEAEITTEALKECGADYVVTSDDLPGLLEKLITGPPIAA